MLCMMSAGIPSCFILEHLDTFALLYIVDVKMNRKKRFLRNEMASQ